MEEIISKANVVLDKNNISPFAKSLYKFHLKNAIIKILSEDVLKNFENVVVYKDKEQRRRFTIVRFKDGELSVQCKFISYEKNTELITPNFLVLVNNGGITTVKYREMGSTYKTLLTNDLHIPCNLKF